MYRRTILRLSVVASFGCVVLANNAMSQQQSLKEQLVGAWAYVSSTAKLPDGSPLWGANPKGLMMFSENGSFSWQIFRSDRPKFASKNRMQGTKCSHLARQPRLFRHILGQRGRKDHHDCRRGEHLSQFRRRDAKADRHPHYG